MDNKYMMAIIRHERARQAVDSLTHEIGISVSRCPIDQEARTGDGVYGNLWTQDKLHTKTHLWQAFQFRETSSCGWGQVGLSEDGVLDALSEGSEYECEHCHHAYTKIIERRHARIELGRARLSIRALGRAALNRLAQDAQPS